MAHGYTGALIVAMNLVNELRIQLGLPTVPPDKLVEYANGVVREADAAGTPLIVTPDEGELEQAAVEQRIFGIG